jgi:UDP-2-acetamido-3-amino-2,3-dideoxy-glucuronate N-acetyltransferase
MDKTLPRWRLVMQTLEHGYYRSPTALIDPTVKIGNGSKIWHFTNIMRDCVIGMDCMIASYVQLDPGTIVGDRTRIQLQCAVTAKIGKDCFIAPHSSFIDAPYPPGRCVKPVLGDNVVVGTGSIIFPVTIGNNAVVSAGSVVTRDVAENMMVRGQPARPCGTRKDYDDKRAHWEQGNYIAYGYPPSETPE